MDKLRLPFIIFFFSEICIMVTNKNISIRNASENNLKSVSLEIPQKKLVVVTGVSGSGKSSLVFDVIYREAESRYLGSLSSFARQFLGKMRHPDVEKISGLSPAIAVSQRSVVSNPRSTVGTITGIYDYLRLLFARLGKPENSDFKINRSLFSFNSPSGACPVCKGLGVEDKLDPDLIIADPGKSLRQGCMVITAPNGYIIYSQVTMDVLDEVCHAEGFSVDIPWQDLTSAQKDIIFYGSDKIEIPYGKHTLESRMRWSGITAKPRETGYYKGILPVMETILQRDRNKNILRFVRTVKCAACHGSRLNDQALSVKINGLNIAGLASLQLDELQLTLNKVPFTGKEATVALPIIHRISKQIDLLKRLGLDYLSLNRDSTTLSGGESQRLHLAMQANTGLSNILYIFDEPSIGLHPRDTLRLIEVLEELRDNGNSVIVVEHDDEFIRHADWIIDMGPAAGANGGYVLQNTDTSRINKLPEAEILKSRTLSFLKGFEKIPMPAHRREGNGILSVKGAKENNLKNIDVDFRLEALNVVTGVSGAGKSTLTNLVLGNFLRHKLHGVSVNPGKCNAISGYESLNKVITIDQSPIGRTPRSNPATYTGLSDHVRDLFAALPLSKMRGWDKGHFSFNTAGGRCEACQGAGYQQIGMHFMGNVEILCDECNGKRFNNDTLEVAYNGKNISDILEMSVAEAMEFFAGNPRIMRYITTLNDLGLGYIKLGQRSSTLSGGEAQRIKLATELARPQSAHTLYILDEPTTGLHQADVDNLLLALYALIEQGNTVILIEHHLALIAAADYIIDLGPESGNNGGQVIARGTPEEVIENSLSYTAQALKHYMEALTVGQFSSSSLPENVVHSESKKTDEVIRFTGITTNNLQNIDVNIPLNKITVLTGVSGSGKSSLAFDTIFAEGQNRFMESFSTYIRTQVGMNAKADFEEVSGLTPTLAVDQRTISANPRSTVGTLTSVYDLYRLLFSRVARSFDGKIPGTSSLFSFNHQAGACPACDGMGYITVCDADMLISHPDKAILTGAMDGSKTGKFYGDPFGQYVATLKAVGRKHQVDFSKPWAELTLPEKNLALLGTGDEIYEVNWQYQRSNTRGEYHFKGKWNGLLSLVNEEYDRKHADQRGQSMLPLMKQQPCHTCDGTRLTPEALQFTIGTMNIAGLSALPVSEALDFFRHIYKALKEPSQIKIAQALVEDIIRRLEFIAGLGLSYLSIDRPSVSLSGGEAQRIRLASQLGSGLTGITYVLDEPTAGLHPYDTGRLIKMLRTLQQTDNTLVVVEHDPQVILSADYIIDMGPGAGKNGGNIIAEGTPDEIIHNPNSLTGKYLLKNNSFPLPTANILKAGLKIKDAFANNLKHFDVEIPSGGMVAITGVSGSGKSSLIYDVIYDSYKKNKACGCSSISGFEHFGQLIAVGRKSQFTAPGGTPVTFTGLFDHIRSLFAATDDASRLHLQKKHFSFNDKEGRCESCGGTGKTRVSMDFLSDVVSVCEQCKGRRYRDEILACHYHGKDIAEVLEMTVEESAGFFGNHKNLCQQLDVLQKVGLGYLQLGQPLDTLSGGESQRLVLATELMKSTKGNTLYLFDEPSNGLHFGDIEYLLRLFEQLAQTGNTLLIIEHNQQIIRQADRVIDLGPEGGNKGGFIVAQGTPAEIMQNPLSLTGICLKDASGYN